MAGDDTVAMQWFYVTPCGRCGHDIQVGKDFSRGKAKYAGTAPVKGKCQKCGHQDSYPPSAVDSKAGSP